MDNATAASPSYPPAFLAAVARVLDDEGGLVRNPADPGGLTRWGISSREYPALDIAALSRDDAIAIYYRDWWIRFRFDALPSEIAAKLFNLAVNMGPTHATACLQRALRACGHRVDDDGVLGPQSVRAAAIAPEIALLAALRSEAAGYYRILAARSRDSRTGGAEEFLKGWLNRAYE